MHENIEEKPFYDPSDMIDLKIDMLAFIKGLSSMDSIIFVGLLDGFSVPKISEHIGITGQSIHMRIKKLKKRWQKFNKYPSTI